MPTYPPPVVEVTPAPQQALRRQAPARRAWWLKTLYEWHWVSSAICLFGMLLFAVTGITLNHPDLIEARPQVVNEVRTVPPQLAELLRAEATDERARPLPRVVREWLGAELGRGIPALAAEWSADEIYLALPRPGGDAWVNIDLRAGEVEYELTDRGVVAWLNDLHKGRNSGTAWSWFIDIFALACVVFSLTGLFILWMHARNRPLVWPMVGLGVVLPLLLVILFVHQ